MCQENAKKVTFVIESKDADVVYNIITLKN